MRKRHQRPHETRVRAVRTPTARPVPASPARSGGLAQTLLGLQGRIGNRRVQRLLQTRGTVPDIQRRRKKRQGLAPAAPERTSVDITGSYEAESPGGNNRITFQLNQAGKHFEGWYQLRKADESGGFQKLGTYRLSGDLESDRGGVLHWKVKRFSGSWSVTGKFITSGGAANLRIALTEGRWSHRFKRLKKAAALSDELINAAPTDIRDLVKAGQRAPLDSDEESRARHQFARVVPKGLDRYMAVNPRFRDARAMSLNSAFKTFFVTIAPQQMPLAVRRAREHLMSVQRTYSGVKRSCLDWVYVVVSNKPQHTKDIQRYLSLKPASLKGIAGQKAPHHYRWRFGVAGLSPDLGAGAGGFLGEFEIQKKKPNRWSSSYFTVQGASSAGASYGVTVGMKTEWSQLYSPIDWASGDFEGSYYISGATVAGAPGVGGGYGKGMIEFRGSGSNPPLFGDASGKVKIFGAYLGAEASVTFGRMWGGRDDAIRSAKQPRISSSSRATTGASAHFEPNESFLAAAGRQEIRRFAALQRAALTNGNSVLKIEGYTSTTASTRRNKTLSRNRAKNALQALKDIVGPGLTSKATAVGYGETPARRAGVPDKKEIRAWRRVDVTLNGRVLLTLR